VIEVSHEIRVVDGDTIEIIDIGETVRILGIDAPETDECGFEEAESALAVMVHRPGTIDLVTNNERDHYGRLLAFVEMDGEDLGFVLLQQGMAMARYDSRDGYSGHSREDAYHAASNQAQAAGLGLWSTCGGFDTPATLATATPASDQISPTRPAPTRPAPTQSTSDRAWCVGQVFPICSAMRDAGCAPAVQGIDDWYRPARDGDKDGVACE
jgi:endonuclease YncB( thermonuclease family)